MGVIYLLCKRCVSSSYPIDVLDLSGPGDNHNKTFEDRINENSLQHSIVTISKYIQANLFFFLFFSKGGGGTLLLDTSSWLSSDIPGLNYIFGIWLIMLDIWKRNRSNEEHSCTAHLKVYTTMKIIRHHIIIIVQLNVGTNDNVF